MGKRAFVFIVILTGLLIFTVEAKGIYILDGYGGVHAVGSPVISPTTPYFGWDIARDIILVPNEGYYVLDGYGGVHAGGNVPSVSGYPYFGFNIARAIEQDRALAAVYFYCGNSGSTIYHSTNVYGSNITVHNGGSPGVCYLDFGTFPAFLYDHNIVATDRSGNPYFVSAYASAAAGSSAYFYRFDAAGAGVNGPINVIVY